MASNTIASLIVKLTSEHAELVNGLDEVKKRLDGVEADTKKASAGIDMIGTVGKRVGQAIASYFTFQAIKSAVTSVLELASSLSDLSARTGVGVEALQEFKFAGAQVGVGLDAITSAMGKMQVNLAGDDKSVVAAFGRFGISISDLRSMRPEEQFAALAEKIRLIIDPSEKAKAAVLAFGKGGLELLPLFASELDKVREKARAMGLVLSEDTITSMDDLGDTMSTLTTAGQGLLANVLLPFVPALTDMANGLLRASSAATGFITANGGLAKVITDANIGLLMSLPNWLVLDDRLAELTKRSDDYVRAGITLAAQQQKNAEAANAAAAAAASLSEQHRKAAEHAAKLAQTEAQMFGTDIIDKANHYKEMLGDVERFTGMAWKKQQEFNVALDAALDLYNQTGRGASAAAKGIREYKDRIEEVVITQRELNSMPLNLGDAIMTLPSVTQNVSLYEIRLAKAMQTTEEFQAENDAFMEGLYAEDAAFQKAQAAAAAHTGSINAGAQAVSRLSAELKMAIPRLFDWAAAYEAAGLIVHKYSLAGGTPSKNPAGEYDDRTGLGFSAGASSGSGSGMGFALIGRAPMGSSSSSRALTVNVGGVHLNARDVPDAASAAAASKRMMDAVTHAVSAAGQRLR